MATCDSRSLRSATWSFRYSSDLARSVSLFIAGVRRYPRQCWRPGWGGFSGARMLVWRWWICRSSLTSLMGGDESWSKRARGCPPVDVPVTCASLRAAACSLTHKASLTMVFLGSSNGGGSAFLPACILTVLELGGDRWLRWLQKTLRIKLYFSFSYDSICKVSE
jgi:hypothetical protein